MLFIWSYSHTVSLCLSYLVVCSPSLTPCAPLWMTVRMRVLLCGVEPRQVAAISGRLWQWEARCVADRLQDVWRSPVWSVEKCQPTAWQAPILSLGVMMLGAKRCYTVLDHHRQS